MILYLNDKKVIRFFGSHPERGKVLPLPTKRVTVGVRWSLPRQQWEPDDDVLVRPSVVLRCRGRGQWQLIVDRRFENLAAQYLREKLS